MFTKLRSRLVLSHILPLVIIMPVIGIVLAYVLETQVLLVNLSNQLLNQAVLVAEMISEQPAVWLDAEYAHGLMWRIHQRIGARIMLLDSRGRLFASSDPTYAQHLGQPLDLPDLKKALDGNTSMHTANGFFSQTEIARVLVPVVSRSQRVLGAVVLTQAGRNGLGSVFAALLPDHWGAGYRFGDEYCNWLVVGATSDPPAATAHGSCG